jgi:alpha-beta hydrolase superfamily lysophospholipase
MNPIVALPTIQRLKSEIRLPHLNEPFYLTGLKSTRLDAQDFGKILVYVAGLGGCLEWATPFWQDVIEDGIIDSVIGIDLRTFGVNQHFPATSLADCIQDLRHLSHVDVLKEAFQIDTTDAFFWSGISLGAMSSLHALEATQDQYQGIALLVPAFKGSPQTYTPSYIIRTLSKTLTASADSVLTLPYTVDAITQCPIVRDVHRQKQGTPHIEHPLGFMTSILPWQLKVKQQLKRIHRPVLLMTAGQDVICDTPTMHRYAEAFAHPTQVHRVHFPSLYHDILLEPERHLLKKPLQAWIQSCLSRLDHRGFRTTD